jgi:hypothetical protein
MVLAIFLAITLPGYAIRTLGGNPAGLLPKCSDLVRRARSRVPRFSPAGRGISRQQLSSRVTRERSMRPMRKIPFLLAARRRRNLYELFTASVRTRISNPEANISQKGGHDNGLHHSARTTHGDGDDTAQAPDCWRTFRSDSLRAQPRTAISAHELGRGHRQQRQPPPSHAVDGGRIVR